jgi:hypothetical protein
MRYVSLADALAFACLVTAGGAHAAEITAAASAKTPTPFDVVRTEIKSEGDTAAFRIAVSGEAGADRPARPAPSPGAVFTPMSGRPASTVRPSASTPSRGSSRWP